MNMGTKPRFGGGCGFAVNKTMQNEAVTDPARGHTRTTSPAAPNIVHLKYLKMPDNAERLAEYVSW
jgi:hypothetical protein